MMSDASNPNRRPSSETAAAGQPGETVITGSFRDPEPERTEAYLGGAAYNFEPTKGALKRYFATRKHPFNLAGISFPGLFAEPPDLDWGWFKIALLIEVVTAFVLSAIVVSVFDLPPVAGVLPFLMFVGVDLALAIGHHWPRPLRSLHKNQELLVTPDLRTAARSEAKYGEFRGGLNTYARPWHGWLSSVCVLLILVMALGKTLFLSANIQELGALFHPADNGNIFASHSSVDQVLQRSEYRTAILMIFGLLYGLVAYIHIKHTGYALAAFHLLRGLKSDRWRHDRSPPDKKLYPVPVPQSVDLRLLAHQLREANDLVYSPLAPGEADLREAIERNGLRVDLSPEQKAAIAPHSIVAKGNGVYELTRRGVLTDEQLQAWVNMQPTTFASRAVALYGHKLQLNMVGGENIDEDIF